MSEYGVKKIDEMEAVYMGAFKRARAELGVESFGMAVIDLPPNFENYPEHDHTHDNQEEVFVAMRGAGEIEIDGTRHPLDADHIASIGIESKRKVWPGPDGVRLLVLSGVPGGTYAAPELSQLGQPDPMAAA
jgi:hypothetical protein